MPLFSPPPSATTPPLCRCPPSVAPDPNAATPHPPLCPGWYVTPRQLKSRAIYNLTSGFCYQGDAFANNNTECQETNSAPVRCTP